MSKEQYKQESRFLSLLLRHKPEAVNLTMDKHDWSINGIGWLVAYNAGVW